jgi:hypothetical protein
MMFYLYGPICPAQVVFQDDFLGNALSSFKWEAVTEEGNLRKNNRLIFSNDCLSSDWDLNYVCTQNTFPRKSGEKVLQMTIDISMTRNSNFILGFFPDTTYSGFSNPGSGLKYGYHGNHLDRTLWFMQGADLDFLDHIPVDHRNRYDHYKLRLELGAKDGALWQYDLGEGWRNGRDTRGEGTGDNREKYRMVLSSCFYADGEVGFDNMIIEYVDPRPTQTIIQPVWPAPLDCEFNGSLTHQFTNWAGTLGGVWTPLSRVDLTTDPGWGVLHVLVQREMDKSPC